MKTTILDLVGVLCLAAFAAFIWLPAALVVIGAAALVASWKSSTWNGKAL
jgi:hypothetical protein